MGPMQTPKKTPIGKPQDTAPTVKVPPIQVSKTSSHPSHKPGIHFGEIGPTNDNIVRVNPTVVSRHGVTYLTAPPGTKGWWKRWSSREEFEQAKKEHGVGIRWVGPLMDESGYGEACRNYVAALHTAGMPVASRGITFGEPQVDYGKPGRVARQTLNLGVPCAIQLTYAPPMNFGAHIDPNSYNIGMFVWEMERLPNEWVVMCNRMDEIWVPCQWNAEVCQRSGVSRPIHVFGHCASPDEYSNIAPLNIPGIDRSWYKFYSIFQWTERKNPGCLLRAYLKAFTQDDPVVLIMKTYGVNYSTEEDARVRTEIGKIRSEVGGNQPRVVLITRMMPKDQILSLHKLGDCFVLPHRSEGWGLPHFEACMMGKPVITTAYGGNLEFTKPEHSYLVDYAQVPNSGMSWFKWYSPDMTWADPSMATCSQWMRHVFENREEAASKGEAAKKYVLDKFSWQTIGPAMRSRIEKIIADL